MLTVDYFYKLTFLDFVIPAVYICIILIAMFVYQNIKLKSNPSYKYFIPGLVLKYVGAIFLSIAYCSVYNGGDTVNYYSSGCASANLLLDNPIEWWNMIWDESKNSYLYFNQTTDYPIYTNSPNAFFVVKLTTPFALLGLNSFIGAAILLCTILYMGIWKLYQLFYKLFPQLQREFAIGILFFPSVFFWGSGILKDSYTLSFLCWFVYCFYHFVILRNYRLKYGIILIISFYIVFAVKPYIILSALPGGLIWATSDIAFKLKNPLFRKIFLPFTLIVSVVGTIYILTSLGDTLGDLSFEKAFANASIKQLDTKQSYYQGNSFDIGTFDGTAGGAISLAPSAIFVCLFRPGLWEVKNFFMLISGLENIILLVITIVLLIKLKFFGFFNQITKHPILLFCFFYAIIFAFMVGISTSNFGTMVRLKIPCIPFYACTLILISYYNKEKLFSKKTLKNRKL